jgi:LacI family transcriptional regulator
VQKTVSGPDPSGPESARTKRAASTGEPSVYDVARHAGVALGTVSNVLNHPHKVAEKTRIKVQRSIDELGFVRNGTAGALAAGTKNTIGFVTIDLSNSFFLDMARGAEEEAQQFGKSLLLANSDLKLTKQDAYLTLFDEERVAGILLAPLPYALQSAERVRSHGRPVVVLNDSASDLDVCSVLVNNQHGGYMAARHLIELGRTRLAFVGGPDSLRPIHDRHEGVKRAVAETNGAVRLEFLPTREVQVEDGRKVGHAIATREKRRVPDGIVAAADLLALGILQSLLSVSDLSVPDDVALIGYDNNRSAWDSMIPISTLSQPGEEMGREAARLLLDEIQSPATHVHRRVILEPTVIARASTVGR